MFVYPLTLDALEGSILSPYCKGFTWINLNQKDLQKEKINKHLFHCGLQELKFAQNSNCVIPSLEEVWRQGGNRLAYYICGSRLQEQAEI